MINDRIYLAGRSRTWEARRAAQQGREGDATTAASYSRYSSDQQDRTSIEQQQHQCHAAAARNGHVILPEFQFVDEAVSGTDPTRAGLLAMLDAAAQRQFGTLYIHSLSRLARESVITMPTLKRLVYVDHVRVISVTEGVDSERNGWEMIAALLAVQHERYLFELAANVHRGHVDNVLKNLAVGDHCFGYTTVPMPGFEIPKIPRRNLKIPKVYVVDEVKVVWVLRIFHWFAEEHRSIAWIVRELNRLQAPKDHRSTKPNWTHVLVVSVLTNVKYTGVWPWGQFMNVRNPLTGKTVQEPRAQEEWESWVRQFPHLVVIDQATFDATQARLDKNRQRFAESRDPQGRFGGSATAAAGGSAPHLLSGLIVCGECGHRFYVSGANAAYMSCPNYRRGKCSCRTTLRRDRAERLLLSFVQQQLLANPTWVQAVYEATRRHWEKHHAELPGERKTIESALRDTDAKIARLVDQVELGEAGPELRQRLQERRDEKRQLQQQLARYPQDDVKQATPPAPEWVQEQLLQLSTIVTGDTPAAAKVLGELLGGQVVVSAVQEGRRRQKFLRGRFHPSFPTLQALPNATWDAAPGDEIVIDFVDTDPLDKLAEQAKQLYDRDLLYVEIAQQMGCVPSAVSMLLQHWSTRHGEPLPDGNQRRVALSQAKSAPPIYQQIADQVKFLVDQDLLFHEIATHLKHDRGTVAQACAFWHTSRGLPIPDGRTRRKGLKRKSSRSSDPGDSDAAA